MVPVATTGGRTVITATPCLPSTLAVIVAVPGDTAVTLPASVTAAIDGEELAHEIVLRCNAAPTASNAVALSGMEPPTSRVAAVGVTSMRAATVLTVTGATFGPSLPQPVPQAPTNNSLVAKPRRERAGAFMVRSPRGAGRGVYSGAYTDSRGKLWDDTTLVHASRDPRPSGRFLPTD